MSKILTVLASLLLTHALFEGIAGISGLALARKSSWSIGAYSVLTAAT